MEKKDIVNVLKVSDEIKNKRMSIVIIAHVILLVAALLWVCAGYIWKMPPSLYEIAVDYPLDIELNGAGTDGSIGFSLGFSGGLLSSLSGFMKPVGYIICALALMIALKGLMSEGMIPHISLVMILFGISHSFVIPVLFDDTDESMPQIERQHTNLKDYIKNGDVDGYINMVKKENPRAAWILSESVSVEPDADMVSNYKDSFRNIDDKLSPIKVALGFSQTISVAQHTEREKDSSDVSMNELVKLKRNAAFTALNFQYVKVGDEISETEQFLFFRLHEAGVEFIGKGDFSYFNYLKRSFEDLIRRAQCFKVASLIFVFLYLVMMVPAFVAWRNERVSRLVEKQLRIFN